MKFRWLYQLKNERHRSKLQGIRPEEIKLTMSKNIVPSFIYELLPKDNILLAQKQ